MDNQPAYLRGRGRGRGVGAPAQTGLGFGDNIGNTNWNYSHDASKDMNSQASSLGPVGSFRSGHSFAGNQANKDVFMEASNRHQEAAKRHLQDFADDLESDEEEIGTNVLQNVFKSYCNNYDNADDTERDIAKAQEHLLHSFRSGTSACLICIENIKREDAIWTCQGCSCMLHLQCIQKWVREGVYQQQYQAEQSGQMLSSDFPWFCPKCRFEYKQIDCPTHSYCFCGKVRDPKFDPWLIPHSCGQTCGRPLKPSCGHACLLNCHPGPCPPCPKMILSSCYCGNSKPEPRRCNARTWACGKVCGRILLCGHHSCEDKCHAGDCQPCPKTSIQACCCGKSKTSRPCSSPVWHCQQICGKRLSCGNHLCEEVCHAGQCGSCSRAGIRKCPCKKTVFNLPCTEDIPTCMDTCGQMLQCGIHACTQRCHYGPCGQCLQVTVKRCRCGLTQKEVLCSKEYLCEKKCLALRDCGKHQCRRKCCDGKCPPCEQMCGKSLACRNHKCPSRCHIGPCYPCNETKEITCFCKATKITVPCGKEKVSKPPRCKLPCKIPPDCHHPERQRHRCHFMECPPCSQICDLLLPKCKHTCPAVCHDAVKIKVVEEKTKREGPWDTRPAFRVDTVKQICPPCRVFMPLECYGKHEVGHFFCSEIRPYSCGKKCGRKLSCGNHTCPKECHVVEGAPDSIQSGENCMPCESSCMKPRPSGCSHPCFLRCHPEACPACTTMLRMRCHCQTVVKHIPCHEWCEASSEEKLSLQSCGGQCPKKMSCNHSCPMLCHVGPCADRSTCQKKVFLKCECKRIKKEAKCCERISGIFLQCDEGCRKIQEEKKQAEEEERKKKQEEEALKQALELEEFERLMKGRRKKPRKHREEKVETQWWQKHWKMLLVTSVVMAIIGVFYVFF